MNYIANEATTKSKLPNNLMITNLNKIKTVTSIYKPQAIIFNWSTNYTSPIGTNPSNTALLFYNSNQLLKNLNQ